MSTELILLGLTLVAIWRTHHLKEFHHAYVGFLVSLAGLHFGYWTTVAGWAITADDAAEHWCEWLPPSPLHYVYARWVVKIPGVSALQALLDKLFRGASSSAGPAGTPLA